MHPFHHAAATPDKAAYIMAASGETVTYGELDTRSNQGSQLFRALGLKAGDAIAIFLDNDPRYYELLWAAQRSGLQFTCISSKLTVGEVEYIVGDSGAKLLVTSPALAEVATALRERLSSVRLYTVSGDLEGYVHNFAADAVLFGAHAGHVQIREYVGQVIARRATDPHRRMHFVGAPVIDGNAGHATAHSYLLWIQLGAESPISAAAEYVDTLVKVDGRWVFQTRTLTRLAGAS